MLCRSCGKESRNPQFCEWCRQPINANVSPPNAPQYPPPMQPGQATQPNAAPTNRRVSLTGEVYEDLPAPTPPPTEYGSRAGNYSPAMPAGAYTPQAFSNIDYDDLPSWGERFEKFLAMGLPTLLGCVLIVRYAPASFLWVVLAASLLLTLMLSSTGVIASLGEEGREAAIIILVAFLLGPLIALAVYGILCLLRQEGSLGVAATLAVPIVVSFLLGFIFRNSADTGAFLAAISLFSIMAFLPVCAAFIGWLIGGMFRPIGE